MRDHGGAGKSRSVCNLLGIFACLNRRLLLLTPILLTPTCTIRIIHPDIHLTPRIRKWFPIMAGLANELPLVAPQRSTGWSSRTEAYVQEHPSSVHGW